MNSWTVKLVKTGPQKQRARTYEKLLLVFVSHRSALIVSRDLKLAVGFESILLFDQLTS